MNNWPLIAVAVWGILVAIGTLKVIKRQTKATEIAADAARLNAQAVINSERPWIVVTVRPNPATEDTFIFQAHNRGRTPAQFISGNAEKRFVDRPGNMPIPPIYCNECERPNNTLMMPTTEFDIPFPGLDIDSFLDSGEKPTAAFAVYPPTGAVNPESIRESRSLAEKMLSTNDVLMFYGRIIYRDVLNRGNDSIHETRWCYAYFTNGKRLLTDGPEEYNSYT